MIPSANVQELEHFDGGDARVLSAYLDLEPVRQVERSFRIVFKDLVRDLAGSLDRAARRQLSGESERVERWLEGREMHGRGLALFSCSPRNLWQVHFLPVRVTDSAMFERKPDIVPLLGLAHELRPFAVALVDREKARLFTIVLGEIEEVAPILDEVPGQHEQGGPAQARYQRHVETHVLWHLKRVVGELEQLLERRRFEHLVLAGPGEVTSELRRLLPPPLEGRIAGMVPAETVLSDAKLRDLALEIERRVERDAEERLVEELVDVAAGAGAATCGLDRTLEALWLGEVRTLVLADGVAAAGSECTNCGRLVAGERATCPACGYGVRPVDDVVFRATELALEQDAGLEAVHDDPARRLREACGGIAARLRFTATG